MEGVRGHEPGTAPERELALVETALAEGDRDGLIAHLAAAIRGFTDRGDVRAAAMAAARLGDVYANWIGNATAALAWFRRAERLVADEPDCPEQGWVAIAAMGCEVDDPDDLLQRSERALALARRFGDVDLETKALADGGLAHVRIGRVAEGFRLLDEAMALACAGTGDAASAAKSVCSFFTACYHTADFERAGTWAAVLRERGMIGPTPPGPAFLSSHCDTVQAALLRELGRWGDAEALLERAVRDFEAVMSAPAWHPAIELADLRISQGRLVDAESLLLGKEGSMQALLPTARLHLARGDAALASATARRGLRALVDDRVRAIELLAVIVQAALTIGDLDGAERAAEDLEARARDLGLPILQARAVAALADVDASAGRVDGAVERLLDAINPLSPAAAPWSRADLHLRAAGLLDAAGRRAEALVEARAAADLIQPLDVVLPAPQQALLRRLLGADARVAPGSSALPAITPTDATLRRDARGWVAEHRGASLRLPDTKGIRYLAELIANPGVERHVLDLVDREEGVAPADSGLDRRRLGDAGPLLDTTARHQYRRRVEALRAEIEDALDAGDDDRAMATQAELDALVTELARAYGLGGRDRVAGSAAERARLNVTRALRSAARRIEDSLPEAGAALDRALRTGLYCAYAPDPAEAIRWHV